MVRHFRSLTAVAAVALCTCVLFAAVAAQCFAAELRRDELYVPAPVERLLPEKRTAYSDTYLLRDGNLRTVFYHEMVRFRDAGGAWQPIDTSLEPRAAEDAGAGFLGLTGGVYQSVGTPMLVTVASEAAGQVPISVSYEGATVSFDLRAADETMKVVSGSEALYLGALPETVLSYEVMAEGVKEEIRLASAAAPNSFTYFVAHDGLELRRDPTGEWGFYRRGEEEPVFCLGEILTYDSSADRAGDPAYAGGARMEVAAAPGGSLVTYHVPRAWLDDPARVFPVIVDPSITLGQSVCTDTFIDSAYPSTSFGSNEELKTGYYSGGSKYSFIKFAVADLRDPDPAYVLDSHLRMYQHYSYSSPPKKTHVNIMAKSWSGSSTWNSLDLGSGDMWLLGEVTSFPDNWLDIACARWTHWWVSQEQPNHGFCILQDPSETTAYYRKFRSSEYATSTQRPRLVVDYTHPTTTVSKTARVYRTGDLVRVRVTVEDITVGDLGAANLIQELRLGVNRATGATNDYRGVLCWERGGVPIPAADWRTSPYKSGGGYFSAFEPTNDAAGTSKITPLLGRCHFNGGGVFDFYFRINDDFGYSTDNRFSCLLKLRTPYDDLWESGWKNIGQSFSVQAPTTVAVEGGSAWLDEDANDDGVADTQSNSDAGGGRGAVALSWPEVRHADGYEIYLFDGANGVAPL